jgi:hypothetical protein
MFGTENDSRDLGHSLAEIAAPVFEKLSTRPPKRFQVGRRVVEMPMDPPPSFGMLDAEIEELSRFIEAVDQNPKLSWFIGYNCKEDWPVDKKKGIAQTYLEWAVLVKKAIKKGQKFPSTWPSEVIVLIIDDLGFAFYPGEPFTQIGLSLAARSPLKETLLISNSNGRNAYVGMDEDRLRGGYETYTVRRHKMLDPTGRPFPYALGAAEFLILNCLDLIKKTLQE